MWKERDFWKQRYVERKIYGNRDLWKKLIRIIDGENTSS